MAVDHRLSVRIRCVQGFFGAVPVVIDQGVGDAQNVCRGTVIAIEKDRLCAWKLLVKIHQYRYIRAAPFVYILVRIPHHEQVLVCRRQNLQ